MILRLDTQDHLDKAVVGLVAQDKRLAQVLAVAGMPTLRKRDSGFAGLAAIICAQQLSTASATAIWTRLRTAYDPLAPGAIAKARADHLGRLGLSAAKIKTLKNLARELIGRRFDLDALAGEDADSAHRKLIALHGIGPWTADVYLLFCLGHADAWPAGDLALQEAIRLGFDLPSRPGAKEMAERAAPWRPLRGAAAYLLWAYYRAEKQREGVLVAPAIKRPRRRTPVPAGT
jgi:DNA-3-methyladenine glycosylase II